MAKRIIFGILINLVLILPSSLTQAVSPSQVGGSSLTLHLGNE